MLGSGSPILVVRASQANWTIVETSVLVTSSPQSQGQWLLLPETLLVGKTSPSLYKSHLFTVTYSWKNPPEECKHLRTGTFLCIPWCEVIYWHWQLARWEGVFIEWSLKGTIGLEQEALPRENGGGDPAGQEKLPYRAFASQQHWSTGLLADLEWAEIPEEFL